MSKSLALMVRAGALGMKRLFPFSQTFPFLLCLGVIGLVLVLEDFSPENWKTIKIYLLSRPFFYHSLVIYLLALVLSLFTYRNLYNFKILLAGFLFLLNGVFGLLFFIGISLPAGQTYDLPQEESLRLLLYLFYSLDLLVIASVPSYLSPRVTRVLLVLFALSESALLVAAVKGRKDFLPFLREHLDLLWTHPLLFLAATNALIAGIALLLSLRRRDPYGWPVAGFLAMFTVAFCVKGLDTEKLIFQSVPFVLSLLVLANLTISLSHRANYDPLMNIYNRSFCNHLMQGRARPLGRRFAVALFDLDHFKRINDRHGHGIGDLVLQQVAQKIREKALPRGMTCRYGGEEIVVIFPDTSLSYAEKVAREIVSSVAQMQIAIARKKTQMSLRITVSGGVAAGESSKSDAGSVLEAADRALYRSKRLGRNRVSAIR
jgi:diguanylate cyclase (GGDEF)-like protein